MNRLVRNLTIKKHYFSIDVVESYEQSVDRVTDMGLDGVDFTFRDCAARDPEDLLSLSDPPIASVTDASAVRPVFFNKQSDFYPYNSCSPKMTKFQ